MKYKYDVAQAEELHLLIKKVNEALKLGYEIVGGINSNAVENQVEYLQAMRIKK